MAKYYKLADGFKMEDAKNQCVCQCVKKEKVNPNATSSPQLTGLGLGYKINQYPWFIPFQ